MEQIQDLAQEVPCHLETLSADVPWRLDWMKAKGESRDGFLYRWKKHIA